MKMARFFVEVDGTSVTEKILHEHIVRMRQPLILRGFASTWEACRQWTTGAAVNKRGGAAKIRMFFANKKGEFHLDGTCNPRTILTCSMSADADIATFVRNEDSWPSLYALDETFGEGHPLFPDLPSEPIPFRSLLGRHVNTQLFISSGYTRTQLHRDPFDNVYVVAAGTRKWSVCSNAHDGFLVGEDPEIISAVNQPHRMDDGTWRWDASETDVAKNAASLTEVTLEAGDAFFLPKGWWHLVQAEAPHSVAVNFYFEPPHEIHEVAIACAVCTFIQEPGGSVLQSGLCEMCGSKLPEAAAIQGAEIELPPPRSPFPPGKKCWDSSSGSSSGSSGSTTTTATSISSTTCTSSFGQIQPQPLFAKVDGCSNSSPGSSGDASLGASSGRGKRKDDDTDHSSGGGGGGARWRHTGVVECLVGADLLRATEPYVLHQCNCVSKGARGLAKALFARWPSADVYRRRAGKASTPGTAEVVAVGPATAVVAVFAQRLPGGPKAGSGDDSAPARLRWFKLGLDAFADEVRLCPGDAVAMPFLVGCGLAGGHWPAYLEAIESWAAARQVSVRLYDKDRQSLSFRA